ncbi:hypothetical protein [Afipia sp. DC4300-2b1]|uniref:hypothetical protein n=1 Tax=Afipia sp. DC4300-2b1 TaxID=2804672 RepID=UPI003CEA186E
MNDKANISEDDAREVLNLDKDKWIIQVGDAELNALKAAIRSHADILANLASEIESIG